MDGIGVGTCASTYSARHLSVVRPTLVGHPHGKKLGLADRQCLGVEHTSTLARQTAFTRVALFLVTHGHLQNYTHASVGFDLLARLEEGQ